MESHYHKFPKTIKVLNCLTQCRDAALITWHTISALEPNGLTKYIKIEEIADALDLCIASIYRHLSNKIYFEDVFRAKDSLILLKVRGVEEVTKSLQIKIDDDAFDYLEMPFSALRDKVVYREYIKRWKSSKHKSIVDDFLSGRIEEKSIPPDKGRHEKRFSCITTRSGASYLLDEDDYKKYSIYSWQESSKGYAVRTATAYEGLAHPKRRNFTIFLHREILGLPRFGAGSRFIGEHINNNPKDNRRCNLQITTQRHNVRKDRYGKGVYLSKNRKRWRAEVVLPATQKGTPGRKVDLGTFDTREEAENEVRIARELMSKNIHPRTKLPLPEPLHPYYDGEFGCLPEGIKMTKYC